MSDHAVSRFHNSPRLEDIFKEANEQLPDQLAADLAPEIERTKALVENAANVPNEIKNDDEEAKATDIVSQMKKHHKIIEGRRKGINAGPTTAKDIIDGFCKNRGLEPLEAAWERIEPGVTKYKRDKVEKARRDAEEKARLAREEAERQRKATEEAQRQQREAEAARQRALDEERRAKEAAARAREEAAAAEARRKEAEARRIEQERIAAETEGKRKKAAAERAAREAQEAADRAQREKDAAKQAEAQERDNAKNAKISAAETRADIAAASREVKTATSLTRHAENDADKADRESAVPAAKLSAARGDLGGHSGLRTKWVGEIIDRAQIDMKTLWPFFTDEQIQAAVDKFVGLHKASSKLKGCRFYESDGTAFR